MKNARLITTIGSIGLLGSAIFHASRYIPLLHRIEVAAIPVPLDGVLKASWLTFSVQFLALAVIAFLARKMEHGGWLVLFCAAILAVDAIILLRFLGPFIGLYLLTVVTVLFLIGGWLQVRHEA